MTEAARLEKIRARHAAIAPGEWMLSSDGTGMLLEARGEAGELIPLLRFDGNATTDEMEFVAEAPETIRFLLGLVDRAILASRAASQASPAGAPAGRRTTDGPQSRPRPAAGGVSKDFAAEAAMKCQEPAFKKFLEERHGLERPLTDERVAQKLRSLLGITTRKELNEDRAAAERWKRLRADFQAWRKAG